MPNTTACESYEVDLHAATFGACKCGFRKSDHSSAATARRQSNGKAKFVVVEKEATAACSSFRVDVTADKFGQCKCGYQKIEHSDAATDTSRGTAAQVLFVAVQKEASGACSSYEIDLTAESFGQCKCGMPKVAHKEIYDGDGPVLKALRAEEERLVEKGRRKEAQFNDQTQPSDARDLPACVPNSFCVTC